ncbi:hypothetical protein L1A47_14250 [Acinetobacter baumannii]|uniref:hypothetical protein n=1 Tax=Acinetobacter baumannii TaxID=470 RepID=UPI00377039D8
MSEINPSKSEKTKLIFIISCFIVLTGVAYRILYLGQIQGSEFVVLVIASMFICLTGYFLKEIQEFSIGGNLFKLRDIGNKSEKLLHDMQIEYYKMRIDMAFKPTGFFGGVGNSIFQSKIEFYNVIREIKDVGLLKNPTLRQKIEIQIRKSLQQQLENVHLIGNVLNENPLNGKVDPLEIRGLISEEIIRKNIKDNDLYRDETTAKNTILMRIEIYENLLKACNWLEE